MLKTFDLVKIFLKENFKRGNNKKRSGKGILAFIIILVLFYFAMFIFTDINTFGLILDNGGSTFDSLSSQIFIMTLMGITFAILSGNRLTLSDKDLAILTPLPISRKKIISAKLITAIITESAFDIVLGLAAVVAMIIIGKYSYVDYISMFLALSLSSIFPMTVFSFLMMWLGQLISKSKKKTLIENIMSMLMMVVVMVPAFMVGFSMGSQTAVTNPLMIKALSYVPFNFLIKLSIVKQNVLFAVIYLASNAVLFIGFVFIFNKYAYKLMIKNKVVDNSVIVSKTPYKKQTIFSTLFKREVKRLFEKPLYFTNFVFMSILFMLIALLPIIFKSKLWEYAVIPISEDGSLKLYTVPLLVLGINLMFGIYSFSPTITPSLDGKVMWIYKSFPIRVRDFMLSKILTNMCIICIPGIVINTAYFAFSMISFLEFLTCMLFMVICAITFSSMYLVLGLRHPKTGVDEIFIVRQATGSIIGMLIQLPVAAVIVGGSIAIELLTGSAALSILVASGVLVLFGLIWVLILVRKGSKLLKKFN
ncbi:MAG: hypothetical protein K6G38_04490 [Gammaproteobacteria bacterium]|nr:hypothetical protein [Gammaproteobacteria bacterium]